MNINLDVVTDISMSFWVIRTKTGRYMDGNWNTTGDIMNAKRFLSQEDAKHGIDMVRNTNLREDLAPGFVSAQFVVQEC